MNKEERRLEFEKFKDEAVIFREREAAVASMSFSTFISAIGPMGIGLLAVTKSLPTGAVVAWIILASSPLGILLTLINWMRVPADFRTAKPILKPLLISLVAAAATWVLVGLFPLRAAPAPPPQEPPPVVQ